MNNDFVLRDGDKITLNGQTVKTTFTSSVIPPHGSQHHPASVSPGPCELDGPDDFGSADNLLLHCLPEPGDDASDPLSHRMPMMACGYAIPLQAGHV